MSITDKLRSWAEGDALRAGMSLRTARDQAIAIADRIDAEHESACAEAYGNGVMSVPIALDESQWVKLPVDADGVPIHIGDEMEGVDKYDTLKEVRGKVITVSFESDGIVDVAIQAWNSDGKSWHRAYLDPDASVYRHYHAPTVEDVLREFALAVCKDDALTIREGVVEKYAAKLRLAEEVDA